MRIQDGHIVRDATKEEIEDFKKCEEESIKTNKQSVIICPKCGYKFEKE